MPSVLRKRLLQFDLAAGPTAGFVLTTLSGLIVWLPSAWRAVRSALTLSFRLTGRARLLVEQVGRRPPAELPRVWSYLHRRTEPGPELQALDLAQDGE